MNILIGQQAEEQLNRSFDNWSKYGRHSLLDTGGVYIDEGVYVAYIIDEDGVVDLDEVSNFESGVKWIRMYKVKNK